MNELDVQQAVTNLRSMITLTKGALNCKVKDAPIARAETEALEHAIEVIKALYKSANITES